jgi:uncharacterized protein
MSSLPLIQDPWFYAVAVPAALLIGLSKSGFAAGFGALSTPLVALTLPVPQAAAIMLPLLLVADAFGLQRLWRQRDAALLKMLLPFGLLGIVLGTMLFGVFTTAAVSGVLGALTLAFLAQRLLFAPQRDGPRAPTWVGQACAVAAGFTSFVAHAGSPPINAYVLPLRLPPLVFAGTMAVFFAALNVAKIVPYAWLGQIDVRNLLTSLLLLPLPPLGVWAGVWLAGRISPAAFYRYAYFGMAFTGVKLLWDGLK